MRPTRDRPGTPPCAPGRESVVCDLPADAALARALCARADVVARRVPARRGVASRNRSGRRSRRDGLLLHHRLRRRRPAHRSRAGHDVNYLGWAGVLADTAPGAPARSDRRPRRRSPRRGDADPRSAARARADGRGARIVVSMTHRSHDLVAHRLGGEPVQRMLTGGLACYRIYATADGRYLTVGALEPKFFARLVRAARTPGARRAPVRRGPGGARRRARGDLRERRSRTWLEHFGDEDVCVGPVWTREEAAAELRGGRRRTRSTSRSARTPTPGAAS